MEPPLIVPVDRLLTMVGTSLSRDAQGEMVHHTVSDNTSVGDLDLHYEVCPKARVIN